MKNKITRIVWTKKAQESLTSILDYRYLEIPSARNIVKKDIIKASKKITFAEQFQRDEILPQFRRIIIRDYKIIYTHKGKTAYILNLVCTKSKV